MGISREEFFKLKNKKYTSSDKTEEWYDEELNEIIFYLIEARKSQRMTQEDVAKLCGCSRSTIARSEALLQQPTIITLIKWCKVLGYKLKIKGE